jgi:hypothetical protein
VGLAMISPAMAADPTKGKVLWEEWFSSPTNDINADLETLKNNARYPNNPNKTYWGSIGMDRPDGGEDYWGCRGRAYLVPPQTGDYTFWTASDDDSELWLSTNEDPANAVMIADVAGWMNYRDFAGASGAPGANFKSDPVKLEAGKRYYIESRQSDGTGGGFVTVAWGGPGIGAGPTVIDAKYFYAYLRDPEPLFFAGSPSPADGALGVTVPMMEWVPGATAFWHNVYFGTDPNPPLVTQLTYPLYFHFDGLQPGVTYYWKVDEVEIDTVTVHAGPVWKFTAQPFKAFRPAPADGATAQLPGLTLTWGLGLDADKQHVYFGNDLTAVTNRDASVDQGLSTDPNFKTEALRASTTYYWAVDTVKADQTVEPGSVWSFTTADAGATNKILWEWWTGLEGVTVAALTDDPNYPAKVTGSQFVDQFASAVDWNNNYGQRLMGWLKPPETGEYTFWIAGDDQQELWLSKDANPANAEMIANVTGWVPAFDWDNANATGGGGMKSAAIPLTAGAKYFIMALGKDGGGGDSTAVAWQGPGVTSIRAIIKGEYVDTVYLPPLQAFGPIPAHHALEVIQAPTLTWNAGEGATKHELYFGDDANAVAAADTSSSLYKGSRTSMSYDAGSLEWGTTYYWRVDQIGAETVRGNVWSFTTADFIPVDNFESYNDEEGTGTRIYETWIDGYTDTLSGSIVGNFDPPFAERTIVHGGMQSMPMDYNNVNAPFLSSAYREFSPVMNWTVNGVTDLSLWVRGRPVMFAEDTTAGTITMSGSGHDIWDAADDFRFAYKRITGDATIIAKVDSLDKTNDWAKAGVMIRETLAAGSAMVYAVVTPSNGVSFGWRPAADGTPDQVNKTGVAAPQWVKLIRKANVFTAQYSADGQTWTSLPKADGTDVSVFMSGSVYIGLGVTSHDVARTTTARFSNITNPGTGAWQVVAIGDDLEPANSPQPLYVIVEESPTKKATVVDPNAARVTTAAWTQWKIPLTSFQGVNLTKVKKLTIGVGDPQNPAPDGYGRVYIDDIRVVKPAPDVNEPAPEEPQP